MIAAIQNQIIFLHANPYLGKVFVFELNPDELVTREKAIRFTPGCLIRMQSTDGLIVVHNLDEKTTQLYDLKLKNYEKPLLKPDC